MLAAVLTVQILAAIPVSAQDSRQPVLPSPLQDSADRARERLEAERTTSTPSRMRLFLDDTVLSPTLAPRVAFSAALDQRSDSPSEWGDGAAGFGRRMAARTALTLSQSGVQHGTAALLRLDPRGDQTRSTSRHPLRRTAHALARTFVTRDTRGRSVPNVPLFAGAFGGALASRAWYPDRDGPGHEAVRVASLTIAAQAGVNVFREFSPELKRLIPGR